MVSPASSAISTLVAEVKGGEKSISSADVILVTPDFTDPTIKPFTKPIIFGVASCISTACATVYGCFFVPSPPVGGGGIVPPKFFKSLVSRIVS